MDGPRRRRQWGRSRFWPPSLALLLGAVTFAAFAVGGDAGGGAQALGVMAAAAGVFWFGARSETVGGIAGPGRDERWSMIDLRATAVSGAALIVAVIVLWLSELAHGRDGDPYAGLAAVGAVAYVVAVVVLRARS